MSESQELNLDIPYPGLRPFDEADHLLFFGRVEQATSLLMQLQDSAFVAVVGSSGSGKSSLVRAGLLPLIRDGYLFGTEDWSIAVSRPEHQPYHRLAEKLAVLNPSVPVSVIWKTLRSADDGLIRALRLLNGDSDRRALIVIDQFEELFGFRRNRNAEQESQSYASRDEAAAFVSMLLTSAQLADDRMRIMITMRSDFVGDCEVFLGLPQAVSQSQFLVPRLTRSQMEEAITGPSRVRHPDATFAAFNFENGLVNTLINEAGDRPDQLPLLQHALMRTWKRSQSRQASFVGHVSNVPVPEENKHVGDISDSTNCRLKGLCSCDYHKAGRIEGALSNDATTALNSLSEAEQRIARHMFLLLCDTSAEGHITRRRPVVQEVMDVAQTSCEQIEKIVRAFQTDHRHFVLPTLREPQPASAPLAPLGRGAGGEGQPQHGIQSLTPSTVLDISHESLLRQWRSLQEWMEEEAKSAEQYRELRAIVRRVRETNKPEFLSEAHLELAQKWAEKLGLGSGITGKQRPNWGGTPRAKSDGRGDRSPESPRPSSTQGVPPSVFPDPRVSLSNSPTSNDGQRDQPGVRWAQRYDDGKSAATDDLPACLQLITDSRQHLEDQKREAIAATERLRKQRKAALIASVIAAICLLISLNSLWDAKQATARAVESEGKAKEKESEAKTQKAEADKAAKLAAENEAKAKKAEAEATAERKNAVDARNTAVAALKKAEKNEKAAVTEREKAETNFKEAEKAKGEAEAEKNKAVSNAMAAEKAKADARKQEILAQRVSYEAKIQYANSAWELGDVAKAWEHLTDTPQNLRGWEHDYLVRKFKTSSLATLDGHSGWITCVSYSQTGQRIVSGSKDKTLKVWNAESEKTLFTLVGHSGWITSVSFSSDGERIVSGSSDGEIKVWNLATGKEELSQAGQSKFVGHSYPQFVTSVSFSFDGKRIVSGSSSGDKIRIIPGEIKLWDAESGKEITPDGGFGSNKESKYRHFQGVNSVDFSSDRKWVVSGSDDGNLIKWNAETGQYMRFVGRHSGNVLSVSFSSDGKKIVSGSADNTVKVWDAETEREPLTFKGHSYGVNSVRFSRDGKQIVSGSSDSTLKVWDVAKGIETRTLKGHTSWVNSVNFSSDGKRIVSGSADNTVKVWNAETAESTPPFAEHSGLVSSTSFSPDGKQIVSGSYDSTLRVWDTATGKETRNLTGHSKAVDSVSFSPDGKLIVSGSVDKTLKVWSVKTGLESLTVLDYRNFLLWRPVR